MRIDRFIASALSIVALSLLGADKASAYLLPEEVLQQNGNQFLAPQGKTESASSARARRTSGAASSAASDEEAPRLETPAQEMESEGPVLSLEERTAERAAQRRERLSTEENLHPGAPLVSSGIGTTAAAIFLVIAGVWTLLRVERKKGRL
jgi:hypothetical protein